MKTPDYDEKMKSRFLRMVDKSGKNGCWIWLGAKKENGYGAFGLKEKLKGYRTRYAHRVSWIIHKGSIPHRLFILHKCDNPPCVNPDHLFAGTQAENIADRIAKGRSNYGKGKLTARDAQLIRKLGEHGLEHEKIAALFGITRSATSMVIRRATWPNVADL